MRRWVADKFMISKIFTLVLFWTACVSPTLAAKLRSPKPCQARIEKSLKAPREEVSDINLTHRALATSRKISRNIQPNDKFTTNKIKGESLFISVTKNRASNTELILLQDDHALTLAYKLKTRGVPQYYCADIWVD